MKRKNNQQYHGSRSQKLSSQSLALPLHFACRFWQVLILCLLFHLNVCMVMDTKGYLWPWAATDSGLLKLIRGINTTTLHTWLHKQFITPVHYIAKWYWDCLIALSNHNICDILLWLRPPAWSIVLGSDVLPNGTPRIYQKLYLTYW